MRKVNTTHDFYACLSAIEQRFNRSLFNNKLPSPLISLKRGLEPFGYFTPNRWQAQTGISVGEIALNPSLFAQHSWLSLMQTFAQQQCHLWQHVYGEPSRPGYHNAEWAEKMQEIGLMPSSTGKPGGRRTGQKVSSYVMPDGPFIQACAELINGTLNAPLASHCSSSVEHVELPVKLRLPRTTLQRLLAPVGSWACEEEDSSGGEYLRQQKRKLKYNCPTCNVSVWGRQGLGLLCQSCGIALRATDP